VISIFSTNQVAILQKMVPTIGMKFMQVSYKKT